jgi:hypothetical protein
MQYKRGRNTPLSRFEDCLRVDGDFGEIAYNNPAAVQRCVPSRAEVVTVYRGSGHEARASLGALVHAILPPRRLPLPSR